MVYVMKSKEVEQIHSHFIQYAPYSRTKGQGHSQKVRINTIQSESHRQKGAIEKSEEKLVRAILVTFRQEKSDKQTRVADRVAGQIHFMEKSRVYIHG